MPRRREALGLLAALALPQRDAGLSRIAFGSCSHQKKPQPIWDAVLGWRPELFLFLGDNVYGDSVRDGLPELVEAYAQARRPGALGRVRASVPVMATWDDHDFGLNDAGADYPHRAASQALFADFWELPGDDPRRGRDGVYSAAAFGPPGRRLQVVLLDTRFFRSPLRRATPAEQIGRGPYGPLVGAGATILGEAQWAWLEERLAEPADLRVLGSSIQVLAQGHGFERWANLPDERDALLRLVREGTGVTVLLSGDRHFGGIYRAPDGLVEITSSGLNMPWANADDAEPMLQGGPYAAENFGTLEIDWTSRAVTAAVRGMTGEIVLSTRLLLG